MYHPPRSGSTYDPNFPPNLDISASLLPKQQDSGVSNDGPIDEYDQERNIAVYGIAGRVWDASFPILPYLTSQGTTDLEFDPPCSIFTALQDGYLRSPVILELGSGQSLASLHLLSEIHRVGEERRGREAEERSRPATGRTKVYLTDLENVVPLVSENVNRWKKKIRQSVQTGEDGKMEDLNLARNGVESDLAENQAWAERSEVDVSSVALPWGDTSAADALLKQASTHNLGLTHILMIDLIYFPHLYPSLLRTLLYITQPPFCLDGDAILEGLEGTDEQTVGPEIILTYRTRSLEFEERFFQSFQRYFRITPLLSRRRSTAPVPAAAPPTPTPEGWQIHGQADGVYTYICRRWRGTLSTRHWLASTDAEVMGGPATEEDGMCRDKAHRDEERRWGWAEAQLGAIEWE